MDELRKQRSIIDYKLSLIEGNVNLISNNLAYPYSLLENPDSDVILVTDQLIFEEFTGMSKTDFWFELINNIEHDTIILDLTDRQYDLNKLILTYLNNNIKNFSGKFIFYGDLITDFPDLNLTVLDSKNKVKNVVDDFKSNNSNEIATYIYNLIEQQYYLNEQLLVILDYNTINILLEMDINLPMAIIDNKISYSEINQLVNDNIIVTTIDYISAAVNPNISVCIQMGPGDYHRLVNSKFNIILTNLINEDAITFPNNLTDVLMIDSSKILLEDTLEYFPQFNLKYSEDSEDLLNFANLFNLDIKLSTVLYKTYMNKLNLYPVIVTLVCGSTPLNSNNIMNEFLASSNVQTSINVYRKFIEEYPDKLDYFIIMHGLDNNFRQLVYSIETIVDIFYELGIEVNRTLLPEEHFKENLVDELIKEYPIMINDTFRYLDDLGNNYYVTYKIKSESTGPDKLLVFKTDGIEITSAWSI